MPANNILKAGMANKRHHAAAIEALFKKNDEQAQAIQLLLFKKWLKENPSVSIPRNDNTIWDAIRRNSCSIDFRWAGLAVLSKKRGIDLTIRDDFFTFLSKYFFNMDKQAATYALHRKMALHFFACFIEIATPDQQPIIFGILIKALSDSDKSIASSACQILRNITKDFLTTNFDFFARQSIEIIKSDTSLTEAERHYISYFLPQLNREDRLTLLHFIAAQENSPEIQQKQLLAWQYLTDKTNDELKLAFAFVWKSLNSTQPISIKKQAWETLSVLLPQLSKIPLRQSILEINSMLKTGSTELVQQVLKTVLKRNIPTIASHALFHKILKTLLNFIKNNRGGGVASCSLNTLALAANHLDQKSRQKSIKVIIDTINTTQEDNIRHAAFDALSSFGPHLDDEQISSLFDQAMNYARSLEFFDFTLQIFIAIIDRLPTEKIAQAIEIVALKNISNLSAIVSLKLIFYTRLASKLEERYLDKINQTILEGFEQYAPDLAISVLQIFLPRLSQNQYQLFFDKAMAFFDCKECGKWQSGLKIIHSMSIYLSPLQIQQYLRKVGLAISEELDAESTAWYLKNKALLFDKVNPEIQTLMVDTLCQAAHHLDYLVRSTSIHALSYLIVRGNVSSKNIKHKLPEPESEFLTYFLNACEQIKQADALPTISYGISY
ncbi:hypothetical protein [Legionella clemsonensis]|nr:hypothetical protein [Legionella clemsonensis]